MSRLVPSHLGVWRKQIPPRDLFASNIEHDGAHDYWLGDFKDFDGDRYAVMRWAAPYETHTTLYVVVRVLWVYANNIDPAEPLKLRNTCGLVSCIQPAHVERIGENKRWTLSKPLPMHDGTLVVPRGLGRVHLCPRDVEYALCGFRYKYSGAWDRFRAEITCPSCVDAAHSSGYVLEVYDAAHR